MAEGVVWCKFGETCVDFHGACVAVNLFIKQKSSVLKPCLKALRTLKQPRVVTGVFITI